MASKNYWVQWLPKDALIAFSKLKADEIGVLIQIINMIYAREGPIENDPAHIGKLCNIQKAKCIRIIQCLIKKDQIYINEEGKITKNRCEEELKEIRKKREKKSKDGKNGAETRWKDEENQGDNDRSAIPSGMANTKTKNNQKKHTNTDGTAARQEGGGEFRPYDIGARLSDNDLQRAKDHAPKWDIYALMREYNERINSGVKEKPFAPPKAFVGWVKQKTGGKPPP